MAANGIRNPNLIWVGQRLAVKGGGAPDARPASAGGGGRWIDVNLSAQRLTAYQGNTAGLQRPDQRRPAAHADGGRAFRHLHQAGVNPHDRPRL